jgi:cytochrome c oxidase subunit 1
VIPAIVDGTIRVNLVMHNTLWVPGHFHFYLLLGVVPMLLGIMLHTCTREQWIETALDRAVFWIYGVAGVIFCTAFLAAGRNSVPRRFAVPELAWVPTAQVATIAAVLVLLAVLFLGGRLLARLPRASLTA